MCNPLPRLAFRHGLEKSLAAMAGPRLQGLPVAIGLESARGKAGRSGKHTLYPENAEAVAIASHNDQMHRPLIVPLTDYVDDLGCILPNSERGHRVAEFATQLVARVTIAYGRQDPLGPIHCRQKRCRGLLRIHFSDDGAIGWYCGRCGDHGWVTQWRRSFFDLLEAPTPGVETLPWTSDEGSAKTH